MSSSMTVDVYWFNLVLTGVSSLLSMFGGAVIVLTYWKMREIRNFTRTLLLYLTIADLLTASGNFVATIRYWYVHDSGFREVSWSHNCSQEMDEGNKSDWVCIGQSFVTTFSNLASFFWTAIIAIHIVISVCMRSRKAENTYVHTALHGISWGIPLGIVTPICILGYLGEDTCFGTGVWCGIRSGLPRDKVKVLMFFADIGWQLPCYLLITLCYMGIKFHLYLKRKYAPSLEFHELSANLRNEDKHFVKVAIVLYALKLWGIIRFFVATYTGEEKLSNNEHLQGFLMSLLFLQSYGASGQAFWNFILFCVLDKEVRGRMMKALKCSSGEELKEIRRYDDSRDTEQLINSMKIEKTYV